MLSRFRYILLSGIMLFSGFRAAAQLAMPDNVCIGASKHYNVDPNPVPGSTYTWKINGVIQTSTANDISITWNTAGSYHLEVQELSVDGCSGPVRSGQVFVNPYVTPIFTPVGSLCLNATVPVLPTTSANGITGTWAPAVSTATPGTTTYTFTPAPGQCASTATLVIKIDSQNIPTFAAIGTLYLNSIPPALPASSTNGIAGIWSPATISTATPGTTTYTFTPVAGQCASTATLVITIEIKAVIAGATFTGACQQLKLNATQSTGTIIKYDWSVLDQGGILTSQTGINTEFLLSSTYSGTLPADFRVKLQVTDSKGNTDSDTVLIKVDRQPVADISLNGQLQKDGSMIVDGGVSVGNGLSYYWFTNEGNIIGNNQQSTVAVNGPGIYFLEITDIHGCKSTKSFRFPLVSNVLVANPDYARTSWSQAVKIPVLDNDIDSDHDINIGSVRIIDLPARGIAVVNNDGTITYSTQINKPGKDQFIYEVCDSVGVCDSALVKIDIYDAGLTIPEAFSPNGDGFNELLIFKGLENYPKSQIHIFTRSGQLVYQSNDYLNDWDGRTFKSTISNKELLPTGTYYYVLQLGGTSRTIKGFVYIDY